MEKCIEQADLAKLTNLQKDQKIKKLEKMLLEKDATILKHQQEQLKLKISVLSGELFKKNIAIGDKDSEIRKTMEEAKELNLILQEKYDTNPGWGYDPDTLLIVEKEN